MNTKTFPKILLIFSSIALLLLIVIAYTVYVDTDENSTDSSKKTDSPLSSSSSSSSVVDNEISSDIPSGWKEYELTKCGIRINVPSDWQTDQALDADNLTFNSPVSIENKKKDWLSQGPDDVADDLEIRCYESLDSMTRDSWKKIQQTNPDFAFPVDLYDALTRKNPSNELTPIFTVQDVKKSKHGDKDAIIAIEQGMFMLTNFYFEHTNGSIVEFVIYIDNEQKNITNKEPQNTILETFEWL